MKKNALRSLISWTPAMLKIAFPVMLQSGLEYVLIFTDQAFIGMYDQAGLSAINSAMPPFFLVISFFFALSQGITIVVSQVLGAKKLLSARRTAETCFGFLSVLSWTMSVFWLIAAPLVMNLMGLKDRQLELAVTYLSLIGLQGLTLGIGLSASSIFQALGNTLPIMLISLAKVVVNIVLNWLLIFGNLGFPALGIAGSAIGTVLSSCMLDLWLFGLLLRIGKKNKFRLRIKMMLRPVWRLNKTVLRIGLPVGLEFILWSLGQTVIVAMVNPLDQYASGYFGVFNTIILLSTQIYNGFGVATLVLVGQATGARRFKDIGTITNWGIISSLIVCILTSIFFMIGGHFLLGLFITDPIKLETLTPLMIWAVLSVFPKAINILAGNAIRGTGNTLWMLKTQIAGTVLIIVVSAIGLYGFNLTLVALLFAVVVDEMARGLINMVKFYVEQRKRIEKLA